MQLREIVIIGGALASFSVFIGGIVLVWQRLDKRVESLEITEVDVDSLQLKMKTQSDQIASLIGRISEIDSIIQKQNDTLLNLQERISHSDITSEITLYSKKADEIISNIENSIVRGENLASRLENISKDVSSLSPALNAIKESKRVIENDGVFFELDYCGRGLYSSDIACYFKISNSNSEDRKACIGKIATAITDTGKNWDGANVRIGNQKEWMQACDDIPPQVTISASLNFSGMSEHYNSDIQFLRVSCGSGCIVESYNETVKEY